MSKYSPIPSSSYWLLNKFETYTNPALSNPLKFLQDRVGPLKGYQRDDHLCGEIYFKDDKLVMLVIRPLLIPKKYMGMEIDFGFDRTRFDGSILILKMSMSN